MSPVRWLPGLAALAAAVVTLGAIGWAAGALGWTRTWDVGRLLAASTPFWAGLVVLAVALPVALVVAVWRAGRVVFVVAAAVTVVIHVTVAARYEAVLPDPAPLVVAGEALLLAVAAGLAAVSPPGRRAGRATWPGARRPSRAPGGRR